ncbi:hypothetical protein B9Z55_011244 [Caenorhabditis nigoni]|uniref:Uncharacterized protein n=1 Tax=Caenorhabditis nigoni TaxID=1611254 RepID=A0A2G5UJ87_9PELO|nr:hypothetical protein B9Z55_011244 [Caenorhabditis nigoni]
MSASDRRFSVTLSEDDLRPHMRKPKPVKPKLEPKVESVAPANSEIEELRKKMEKREAVKKEVKRRIEEEEKEKERKKAEEEIRRETEELLAIRAISRAESRAEISVGSRPVPRVTGPMPRLGRRVNNFQYFKWDSDEEEVQAIPAEFRPQSRRSFTSIPRSQGSCELCTLALRSVDKSGGPTKSAACAHVDAFVEASSRH